MPKRRDDIKTTEQVGIRLTSDLRERCKTARLSGAFKSTAEAQFLVYLVEIGLSKYEKAILPHEKDENIETIEIRGGINAESKSKIA